MAQLNKIKKMGYWIKENGSDARERGERERDSLVATLQLREN